MSKKRPKPVILIMLDGYGIAPPGDGNAILLAKRPVMDQLAAKYPVMTLRASGDEVGLSWGEMGNSEVGHLTAGAGRVFYQTLPRINKSIQDKSFFENEVLKKAAARVKERKSTLHFLGLVSPGSVHSTYEHLFALLDFAKKEKVKNAAVHAILDGRDTVYNSGIDFIKKLLEKMKKLKFGELASLSGRHYAMDRDNRWDRTEKAYNAITGIGPQAEDPVAAIKESYAKEVFDEQFAPVFISKKGEPAAPVREGDAVIFFNFRPDRSRQLTRAFVLSDFKEFAREKISDLFFATMTEYEEGLPAEIIFPREHITKPLARVISEAGLKQFHIAETEKYAHVTYFFNGMKEDHFDGEERALIPSPKVSSYDEKPEMSAREITKRCVKEIDKDKFDFIVMNYANADMVGHTGNLKAAIKGIEIIDECIGQITSAALAQGGVVVITADHGNAESMKNLQTGDIDKEHSTNPIPFLAVGKEFEGMPSPAEEAPGGDLSLVPTVGVLADIAPTILKIMGLKAPEEMTGRPLI